MYYGTEVGMTGAHEPDNREDMKWGKNASLTSYTRTLMHLRHELAPLRRGKQLEMWQDDDVYGYSRLAGKDEVIVMLNNSDKPQSRLVPLRHESALQDGTVLGNRLGKETITVQNRQIKVNLGPKQAQVLVVKSGGTKKRR